MSSRNLRSCTNKISPTWLSKNHELNKDNNNKGAKKTRESRFQPNAKNLKLLSNAESKKNNLPGKRIKIIYLIWSALKNIYASYIIQTEQLVFISLRTYMYRHIYINN